MVKQVLLRPVVNFSQVHWLCMVFTMFDAKPMSSGIMVNVG